MPARQAPPPSAPRPAPTQQAAPPAPQQHAMAPAPAAPSALAQAAPQQPGMFAQSKFIDVHSIILSLS